MNKFLTLLALGGTTWIAGTVAALAQSHPQRPPHCHSCTTINVPEIDVSSGLLAVAAVAAALLLVWELRRRRAA